MKRKLAGVVIAAGLAGGALAPAASADPGIGAPRSPSCFGQFVSSGAQQYGGVPNLANAFGVTIQQGHNLVRAVLCGRTSGFTPGS